MPIQAAFIWSFCLPFWLSDWLCVFFITFIVPFFLPPPPASLSLYVSNFSPFRNCKCYLFLSNSAPPFSSSSSSPFPPPSFLSLHNLYSATEGQTEKTSKSLLQCLMVMSQCCLVTGAFQWLLWTTLNSRWPGNCAWKWDVPKPASGRHPFRTTQAVGHGLNVTAECKGSSSVS